MIEVATDWNPQNLECRHWIHARCNGYLYGLASYSREDAHATLVKVLKKEWGEGVKYTNVTF